MRTNKAQRQMGTDIIAGIMNAGTLTKAKRDEILIHASETVTETFKSMQRRYEVKGYDKIIHSLFKYLLEPYFVFNEKLDLDERQTKRILGTLSVYNRVKILELLGRLKGMPEYVYRNYEKKDVKRVIHWIRKAIEQLYTSCHWFQDARMYSTNMYLPDIEKWINGLEIEYIPKTAKIQKELRNQIVEVQKKRNNEPEENNTGQIKYLIPNNNMIHEILETPRMKNMIAINSFFYVPDGERPAGNDWYDTDGNITYDEKEMVTKKPHMMWYDENDLPTCNPNFRIPEKDKVAMVQLTRDAETNEDFEIIYQKELKLFNANDGIAFKQWLTKKVNDLLAYEQALPANESVHTAKAQDLCIRFIKWMDKKEALEKVNDFSHREIIIAHFFKYKAGIENDKTAPQWKQERGEKARQSFYTTLKQSKNYKPHTIEELSKVIELLKEFPTAQKMAINKKAELESL